MRDGLPPPSDKHDDDNHSLTRGRHSSIKRQLLLIALLVLLVAAYWFVNGSPWFGDGQSSMPTTTPTKEHPAENKVGAIPSKYQTHEEIFAAVMQQVDVYLKNHRHRQAITLLQDTARSFKGKNEHYSLLAQALALLLEGDRISATTIAKAAAAADPDDFYGYTVLSRIYFDRGLYSDAAKWAKKAYKLNPTTEALDELANAEMKSEDYSAAITHLQVLADQTPDNTHYQILLIYCFDKLGNEEQAQAHFHKLQQLDPTFAKPNAYFSIIQVLDQEE